MRYLYTYIVATWLHMFLNTICIFFMWGLEGMSLMSLSSRALSVLCAPLLFPLATAVMFLPQLRDHDDIPGGELPWIACFCFCVMISYPVVWFLEIWDKIREQEGEGLK